MKSRREGKSSWEREMDLKARVEREREVDPKTRRERGGRSKD